MQTIRDHSRCTEGWKKLTKAVGSDLTTELSIGDVLISNGLDDALWCIQCLEPRVRVEAIMPAVKRASVHTKDQRVHDCIAAIEKWLAGDDTVDLEVAARAAEEAAWAAGAAGSAARAARAAEEAAWAAGAAEGAAAGSAARESLAAAGVARAAERKLQEADLLAMFPPIILKGEQQ